MNNMEGTYKKGHGTLGLVLGIVGIVLAGGATILFGIYGAAVGILLGAVALILGIRSKKYGKGTGAIVTGILSIILAIAMAGVVVGSLTLIRDQARKMDNVPLVVECLDKPEQGLMGIAMKLPSGEENAEELTRQITLVTKEISNCSDGTVTVSTTLETGTTVTVTTETTETDAPAANP